MAASSQSIGQACGFVGIAVLAAASCAADACGRVPDTNDEARSSAKLARQETEGESMPDKPKPAPQENVESRGLSQSTKLPPEVIPVLREGAQLQSYVGRVVVVEGNVDTTKLLRVSGVRLTAGGEELRNKYVRVQGRLMAHQVTKEQFERNRDPSRMIATSSPGTYYVLTEMVVLEVREQDK
jgi:hypothetical protein